MLLPSGFLEDDDEDEDEKDTSSYFRLRVLSSLKSPTRLPTRLLALKQARLKRAVLR